MSRGYYVDHDGIVREATSLDLISGNVIEVILEDGQIDGMYTYYRDLETLTGKLNEHLY